MSPQTQVGAATRGPGRCATTPAAVGLDCIDQPACGAASALDMMRRALFDGPSVTEASADERADLVPLVALAAAHIEALQSHGLKKLPWRVAMFGRAHVTIDEMPVMLPRDPGSVRFVDLAAARRNERTALRTPPLPESRYGEPVDIYADVTTEASGALLLYANGVARRVYPYRTGSIWHMERPTGSTRPLQASHQ